jgi:hypothetical protein
MVFEYPLIYNYSPFSDIGCAPRIVGVDSGGINVWVGERIWISIYAAEGETIAELAADFIGDGASVRNAARAA